MNEEKPMATILDPKQTVDLREVVISEIIQSEALVNLLEKKGIITKQEWLEEIMKIQASILKSEK
jgi:hypothetical protein